ncbi:MAG: isochorismatase family protein [Planctomycetota bacterium]|nr:MAG: isochorismatase family protein [Planctomycetota bacterium]
MRDRTESRRRFLAASAAGCLLGGVAVLRADDEQAGDPLLLPFRFQERLPDSDEYSEKFGVVKIRPRETAILICDMWNQHWCKSATRRCGELAEKMAPLIDKARGKGVHIVHCPSSTLDHYKDHPARKRALAVPPAEPPVPIAGWCSLEEEKEGKLPIDDSDGGCDCQPQCKQGSPWTRQHPAITIAEEDFISDDGKQVYSYFVQQGIKHVIYVGVHTNMCVLGRSFGIRQMSKLGLKPYLVADLTDTMYNPRMAPYVPHDEGTQLVISHVERHWCPTTTSGTLAAGLRL